MQTALNIIAFIIKDIINIINIHIARITIIETTTDIKTNSNWINSLDHNTFIIEENNYIVTIYAYFVVSSESTIRIPIVPTTVSSIHIITSKISLFAFSLGQNSRY